MKKAATAKIAKMYLFFTLLLYRHPMMDAPLMLKESHCPPVLNPFIKFSNRTIDSISGFINVVFAEV
jgi:hypothetical protein